MLAYLLVFTATASGFFACWAWRNHSAHVEYEQQRAEARGAR